MATGKCEKVKRLKSTNLSYKDETGVSASSSKNYTKTNFGYSVPSGYNTTLIGIRAFGDPYWSHVYGLNNSSNLLQVHNFVGGFADKNGTNRFFCVFVKDDGTLVSG